MADIATLIAKWRNGLEVEIYTENYEFRYGRIKSSRFNASGEESVYFMQLTFILVPSQRTMIHF